MKNSPVKSGRTYAPRAAVKRKRVLVGLDTAQLAECHQWAQGKRLSAGAYVLEVYLEGQAARRARLTAVAGSACN